MKLTQTQKHILVAVIVIAAIVVVYFNTAPIYR